MTAVVAAVALALVAALVVLVDVKPWRRPTRVLEVRVTVDTQAFREAMIRAGASFRVAGAAFARMAPTVAQASTRLEQLGQALWRIEYQRTKDLPAPADPCPFPRLRVVRWLP